MTNPIEVFKEWLADAKKVKEIKEPTAMSVATVDAEGRPEVRMVLLKGVDERGFVFYTNTLSHKGEELKARPVASLCFYWNPPGRQVRVSGEVERVTDEEADAYFASRAYLSKIGAWASKQSQPLGGYAELERAVAATMLKYPLGKVPRPSHWSGYRVKAERIELWEELPFRLHRRVVYRRGADGNWMGQALYP